MQILGQILIPIGMILILTWVPTAWQIIKEGNWRQQGGWGALIWLAWYLLIVVLGATLSKLGNEFEINIICIVGTIPFTLGAAAIYWHVSWKYCGPATKPLFFSSPSHSCLIGLVSYGLVAIGITLGFAGNLLVGFTMIVAIIGVRLLAETKAVRRVYRNEI